jgi:hypothetical protein
MIDNRSIQRDKNNALAGAPNIDLSSKIQRFDVFMLHSIKIILKNIM